MTHTFQKGTGPAAYRIDLSCEETDFSTPPFDVAIRCEAPESTGDGWVLVANTAPGKPDLIARWLAEHPGIEQLLVAPGLSPKTLRATVASLPPAWSTMASFVHVHHLALSADGHASWFIEGPRAHVLAAVKQLEAKGTGPFAAPDLRCRPLRAGRNPITPRQFQVLSTAVALGYYNIPHRIDLRTLAARTGVSLGSFSELLRRAEAAVLTHFMDAAHMAATTSDENPDGYAPANLLDRPPNLLHVGARPGNVRPSPGRLEPHHRFPRMESRPVSRPWLQDADQGDGSLR